MPFVSVPNKLVSKQLIRKEEGRKEGRSNEEAWIDGTRKERRK